MIPSEDRWSFPADACFGLAEAWLGTPLASHAAPETLVRRYLTAFGPATIADVQQWSGLPAMKPVLEAMRPELAVFRDERGRTLFDLPDAPRPDAGIPPPRFLPEFDNLLLSHADRTRVLPEEYRRLVLGAKNGRVPGTFLVAGFVAGTWRIERKKQAATLALTPFARLPQAAIHALAEEGEALLRFQDPDATAFRVEHIAPVSTA
jgi:hypothetical protein